MSKFKGTKGMLILIVLVCAVIGYYYYVANRGPKAEESKMTEETAEITPVQNVLMRNLETNYPPTPKEVVKYYACLYEPEAVVRRAVKDAFKKKDVSLYGFKSKVNVLLAKIIPHKIVMSVWMKQQKLK